MVSTFTAKKAASICHSNCFLVLQMFFPLPLFAIQKNWQTLTNSFRIVKPRRHCLQSTAKEISLHFVSVDILHYRTVHCCVHQSFLGCSFTRCTGTIDFQSSYMYTVHVGSSVLYIQYRGLPKLQCSTCVWHRVNCTMHVFVYYYYWKAFFPFSLHWP